MIELRVAKFKYSATDDANVLAEFRFELQKSNVEMQRFATQMVKTEKLQGR